MARLTSASLLALLLAAPCAAFTPHARTSFATFGNAEAKALLKLWQPQPLNVPNGEVMLPSSTENMKRFVRARILLEDPSLGLIASFDDSLCVILCRFSKAEHQLVLPLWQPSCQEHARTFKDLRAWHKDLFGGASDAPRLSGARLETDQDAWAEFDA